MDRRPTLTDADVGTWLSAPVEEPPFDLVTRAVTASRRVRQRPSMLALAMGAPALGRRRSPIVFTPRTGVVLIAALTLTAIVGITIGGPRTDRSPTPSALASQSLASLAPTTQPRATPRPTASASPFPRGTVVVPVPFDDLGLTLMVTDGSTVDEQADRVSADGMLVTIGDRSKGAAIAPASGRSESRVWARDVDAVIDRIRALAGVEVDEVGPVDIDGEQGKLVWLRGVSASLGAGREVRPLAIVEHGGRLFLTRPVGATAGSSAALDALATYVDRFDWIDPATFRGDGFTLTMPDSWHVSQKGSTTIVRQGGEIFSPAFEIDTYKLGSKIVVPRGYQVAPVTISGRDLATLRASIEEALPGAADGRLAIRVDGAKGYRFVVPQATIMQPLAALAVVVVGDRVSVITLTLALDGTPDLEAFRTLLDGMRFDH